MVLFSRWELFCSLRLSLSYEFARSFEPYPSWGPRIKSTNLDTFDFQETRGVPEHDQLLPLWTLWRIWKSRNYLIFQKKRPEPLKDVQFANAQVKAWLDASHVRLLRIKQDLQIITISKIVKVSLYIGDRLVWVTLHLL